MAAPRLNRALLLVALSAAYFVATLPYPAAAERNAAAPNANEVLPTPVNVEEACTKEVFHSLTHHYRSCSRSFFHVEDPDEDCCEGLAHFYGPQSPMPSRNCFCDATYAAWFTKMNFNITVGYFDDGEGPCAGKEYSAEDVEGTCINCYKDGPHASLADWLSRLDQDWGIAMSFAIFWVSLFGCIILVGSLTLDLAKDAQRVVAKKMS